MSNVQRPTPNKLLPFGIIFFIALIAIIALSNSLFLTINPGERGVLFKRFSGGLQTDNIYGQGFHVIAPWNKMYRYDVRVNEAVEKMQILSKNGLNIGVELSFRYQPEPEKIGYLHNEVGTQYLSRIIIPEIRAATREVIGKYLPEELYSSKRESIQTEIFERTRDAVARKNLILDAVLIRDVGLPEKVKGAIEEKLEAEQAALKFEFILQQEKQEAERKVIEAQAKADANRLLNASLTDKILQDKGIEATLELANSPNSKVVIVGSGDSGMPLILGN